MIVLLLTRDLMFQPKVALAARSSGKELIAAGTLAALQSKRPEGAEVAFLVIDLGLSGLDVAATVSEARRLFEGVAIIAFGPHVHVEQLHAARDAGCDAVLTRGQFEGNMGSLFQTAT